MSLPKRLRKLRRDQDLTQQKLAELAGLNFVTVSRVEQKKDDASIYLGTAKRLAKALGVSLDYLAGMDEEEEEESQVRRKSPDRKPAAKRNVKTGMPKRTRTPAKAAKE
jgi:transcriptional regulator with XRE-family HTH domain